MLDCCIIIRLNRDSVFNVTQYLVIIIIILDYFLYYFCLYNIECLQYLHVL